MSDPNVNVPLPGSISPTPDSPRKSRTPLFITLAIVIAVVLAILLYLFQPWTLFTGKEVNEDLPSSSASSSVSGTASATPQVWGSVVIWSDRFSVPFGAASLNAAAPSARTGAPRSSGLASQVGSRAWVNLRE